MFPRGKHSQDSYESIGIFFFGKSIGNFAKNHPYLFPRGKFFASSKNKISDRFPKKIFCNRFLRVWKMNSAGEQKFSEISKIFLPFAPTKWLSCRWLAPESDKTYAVFPTRLVVTTLKVVHPNGFKEFGPL